MRKTLLMAVSMATFFTSPAFADDQINDLRKDINQMRTFYEQRIADLEQKLQKLEQQKPETTTATTTTPATARRKTYDNSFNPSIGVILNGKFSAFGEGSNEIAGFGVGEEGERGREGFAIDESELNFSGTIDDKFGGSLTAAIVREDGEDKIELEEAYIQTLGLPHGLNVKAGRAFWKLGYLNEHHAHTDDFADRPLPYRVFLNKAYNDDGAQASWILPTPFYSEIGGGVFRGDDFPLGSGNGEGIGAWLAYAKIGGDIGENHAWQIGASMLNGETNGRSSNEDNVTFIGDSDLYAADLRYTWAPTGNAKNEELILQGEYFWRDERGTYEDTATGQVAFDDTATGWYGQAVYKFLPQWRVGYRYTEMTSPGTPAGLAGSTLDSGGHDPYIHSVMLDWTNSEFSRLRFQYNQDNAMNVTDDQFLLQYVVSFGAHGAHQF